MSLLRSRKWRQHHHRIHASNRRQKVTKKQTLGFTRLNIGTYSQNGCGYFSSRFQPSNHPQPEKMQQQRPRFQELIRRNTIILSIQRRIGKPNLEEFSKIPQVPCGLPFPHRPRGPAALRIKTAPVIPHVSGGRIDHHGNAMLGADGPVDRHSLSHSGHQVPLGLTGPS
jgi:hypothetical protein